MHRGIIEHPLKHCDGTPLEAKRSQALVSVFEEKERERVMVVGAWNPASEAVLVSAIEEKGREAKIGGFFELGHFSHKTQNPRGSSLSWVFLLVVACTIPPHWGGVIKHRTSSSEAKIGVFFELGHFAHKTQNPRGSSLS